MTIRHLRIFRTVCEKGSVTAAADALYMTQPAVSRALAELEREAGVPLFDRLGRRLLLNGTGKVFLGKAVRALDLLEDLEKGTAFLERQAPLRLGSSITLATYWLPPALRELAAVYPEVPLRVTVERAAAVLELLENGGVDLALLEGAPVQGPFIRLPFSTYRLCVVAAAGSPLTKRPEPWALTELAGETWLLREKGSAVRDMLDSALLLEGLSIEPRMTSVNSQALIQAVRAGLGITILPDILVKEALDKGLLAQVPLVGPPLISENAVVLHRDKHLTEPMNRLLALLREAQPFL